MVQKRADVNKDVYAEKDEREGQRGMRVPAVWLLACVLLVVSGAGYRVLAGYLGRLDTSTRLPVPLKNIPAEIGDWRGQDVELSETVLKIAGNDDYLHRFYVNSETSQWANVYVAYSANPRSMLGHRPQVCYPNAGWQHGSTDHIDITSVLGREVPCLLHRFYRAGSDTDGIVVLNYYVVNGKMTDEERTFSGVGWRTPNVSGDIARYVAQVQISSTLENSAMAAAREFADAIIDYLPEENGTVRAAIGY